MVLGGGMKSGCWATSFKSGEDVCPSYRRREGVRDGSFPRQWQLASRVRLEGVDDEVGRISGRTHDGQGEGALRHQARIAAYPASPQMQSRRLPRRRSGEGIYAMMVAGCFSACDRPRRAVDVHTRGAHWCGTVWPFRTSCLHQ